VCVGAPGRCLYTSVTNSPRYEVRETSYLVEIDADLIPTPGYNPGFETQRFVAVAWIPLEHLSEDIQVSKVLIALSDASGDASEMSHTPP